MRAVLPSGRISAPIRRISSMCMKRFSKIVSVMVPTPSATVLSAANCACMSVGNAGYGAVRTSTDLSARPRMSTSTQFSPTPSVARALKVGAHRDEEVREIDDLGLASGVLDDGLPVGERGGHHQILRAGDGDGVEHQPRALQARGAGADVAPLACHV